MSRRQVKFGQSDRIVGSGFSRRLVTRLVALSVVLMIATTAFISERSLNAVAREVQPEFNREAGVVGGAIAGQIARALELGIPLDHLVGMDEFLDPVLAARSSFDYLIVSDPAGQPLYARGRLIDRFQHAIADHAISLAAPENGLDGERAAQVTTFGGLFNTAIPISANGQVQAWLHIGVDASSLDRMVSDTRWDVAIVLMVSLLTTIELMAFLVDRSLSTPLRLIEQLSAKVATGNWTARVEATSHDETGRLLRGFSAIIRRVNDHWDRLGWKAAEVERANPRVAGRLRRIREAIGQHATFRTGRGIVERPAHSAAIARTPLFIYIFAEQLSTSFMPLYARQLYKPFWGMDQSLLIGMPITIFMAGIAFATPFGGTLVRRHGARRVFLMGVVPAFLGYVMVAFAGSLSALIFWRAVTSVGYSLITIAAQGYLAAIAREQKRAQSMAVFVSAVMTGAACGTAVGAVMADRIGYAATFLVSAGLVLIAAAFVWIYMEEPRVDAATQAPTAPRAARGSLIKAMLNPRFAALILFAAIPGKIVLTGFIFYLAPLYLTSLSLPQPAIGRTIMSYSLAMIATIGVSAKLSDRLGWAGQQIVWAGLVTGLGTVAILFLDPAAAVLISIMVFGLCQGLAAAPMLAIVPEICPEESRKLGPATLFGYLRLGERIGSMAGPFIAAGLIAAVGYADAILSLGAISTVAAVIYAIIHYTSRRPAGAVTP